MTSPREHSPSFARQQQQYEQPAQQQQRPRASEPSLRQQQARDPYSSSSSSRPQPDAASFSTLAAERAYGVESVDGPYDRGAQMYGGADGSFNGGAYGGSATGGKGWGGLLKSVTKTAATLGKKGLKAAQVRLYVCATKPARRGWSCWVVLWRPHPASSGSPQFVGRGVLITGS